MPCSIADGSASVIYQKFLAIFCFDDKIDAFLVCQDFSSQIAMNGPLCSSQRLPLCIERRKAVQYFQGLHAHPRWIIFYVQEAFDGPIHSEDLSPMISDDQSIRDALENGFELGGALSHLLFHLPSLGDITHHHYTAHNLPLSIAHRR